MEGTAGAPEGEAPRKALLCFSEAPALQPEGGDGTGSTGHLARSLSQWAGGAPRSGRFGRFVEVEVALNHFLSKGCFLFPHCSLTLAPSGHLGSVPWPPHPSLRAGFLHHLQVLPPAQYSLSAALGQISLFGTKRLLWLLPKQVPRPGCNCSEYTLKISTAVKILISAPSKMIYPPSGDPGWARPSQPDP